MNANNILRREWQQMQDRFLAESGISMTEKESDALWLSYGLGALAWNRLLMTAGDNTARRQALLEALAEFALEMSAGDAVRRVM